MFEVNTRDWIIKLNPESHPDELIVEVATTCNMDCFHCFRKSAKELKPQIIDIQLFEKVLNESIRCKVKKIVFSGWGEPFTHPRLDYIVEMCKKYGLEVAINTNGLLLGKFMDLIIDYIDELYISLDAATTQTYNYIRAPNVFNYVIQNIRELTKIKQQRGLLKPYTKALFTVTKTNVNEVEDLLYLARDLGFNEVIFSFSIPYDSMDGVGCLSSIECINNFFSKFQEALNKVKEIGLGITTPRMLYTPSVRCPFATNRALFIRSDGAITPCIYYAYSWTPSIFGIRRNVKAVILGYIDRNNLMDIWRGRYAKMFYKLNLRKSIPSCLTCTLVNYCVKTRSNEVDCLGNEPNCGHCPFYHSLTFCPL
ncbi:MAG: radical SAM protein [Ignisphaera sp.]